VGCEDHFFLPTDMEREGKIKIRTDRENEANEKTVEKRERS
jgi:hypothetical protein